MRCDDLIFGVGCCKADGEERQAWQNHLHLICPGLYVRRWLLHVFTGKVCPERSFSFYLDTCDHIHMPVSGLAEALRNEMLLYGIDVHILFPGTIYSPGYEEENKTKPKITLKIEEADEGLKPEAVAQRLLEGKQFHQVPLCNADSKIM
jgi:hypothetical protein